MSKDDSASKASRRERGLVRVEAWLPAEAAAALDDLALFDGSSRAEALISCIRVRRASLPYLPISSAMTSHGLGTACSRMPIGPDQKRVLDVIRRFAITCGLGTARAFVLCASELETLTLEERMGVVEAWEREAAYGRSAVDAEEEAPEKTEPPKTER